MPSAVSAAEEALLRLAHAGGGVSMEEVEAGVLALEAALAAEASP